MKISRLLALPVLLGLAASCATARPQQPVVGDAPTGVQVRVENASGSDVRIFARQGGSEVLLGRVQDGQQRNLHLPLGLSGSMSLVARAASIGLDPGHSSEPFTIGPGQYVSWRLRDSPGASDSPRLSTLQVFSCEAERSC